VIGEDGTSGADLGNDPSRDAVNPGPPLEISARHAASRGVLRPLQELRNPNTAKQSQEPLFGEMIQGLESKTVLAPNLDDELDQAHRFTLIGRIFRPFSDFLRRALGGELLRGSGDPESGESK